MKTPGRGFMLLEMIGALILLTAFALVATHLFTWSMRVVREAPPAEHQVLSFDSMLAAMRADVWPAASARAADDRHVEAGAVRWSVAEDGSVVRTAGGETRAWPELGRRVRFEPAEAGVLVRVLDRRGAVSDRIALVSQVELLRRTGG